MSLTKSRNYNFPAPPGEYAAECSVCGMEWYRSDLTRTPDGLLTCPDDIEGRDTVTLDRLSQAASVAAAAEMLRGRKAPW